MLKETSAMKFNKINLKTVLMIVSVFSLSGCQELDVYLGICKLADSLDRSYTNENHYNDSFEERPLYDGRSRGYDVSDLVDRMDEIGANCVYIDQLCDDRPQDCGDRDQLKQDLADEGIADCGDALYCQVPTDARPAGRPTRTNLR